MITETSRKLQAAGEQMVYITIMQWVYDRTVAHWIYTAMLGSGPKVLCLLSSVHPLILGNNLN